MSDKLTIEPYFAVPEEEWLAACRTQCVARRKLYPGTDDDCDHDGLCEECVNDAAARVPLKYRVPKDEAMGLDPLPGVVFS